ncbi:MOSC domain-containing protein [Parvibium lacunae]|uniref:MOSC domain-containing protein n=1 Tax=Parvibium lacunae TaxID=1888893 RepID=A0A368L0L0_9BURK|nr:MOSC N-terminal beta barrel domain-containing protein [Parvibium lacunae]RCS57076.1 MOSC domain-containing protein [Parvibium lacunae]
MPTLTITDLSIYPIKSCAGITLETALVTAHGLQYDRHWVIVDHQQHFLTQRQHPRMALIQPSLSKQQLQLSAPGMSPLVLSTEPPKQPDSPCNVTVWRDSIPAWDEGNQAAQWLSEFLAQPVRLMRYAEPYQRACDPQWAGDSKAYTHFADGYPILVVNTASLAELNQRLAANGSTAIPMNRFRANIVVSGDELGAFEEDYLETLSSMGLVLRAVKPCARCSVPSVDQQTGVHTGPEPTATLTHFRHDPRVQGVTFGQNLIIEAGAGTTLTVGSTLHAALNF